MSAPAADLVAEAVGAGLAPAVVSGTATLRAVEVPGVGNNVVWLVRDDDVDHPMQAYVGVWPQGAVRRLSDDQPAFFDLAASWGADIRDASTAIAYVRAFLEVTRGPSVLVREIERAADLPWRPGSASEEANRVDFEARDAVEPPLVQRDDGRFHVELTLMVDQRVQRNTFEVGRDGTIESSYRILAADLPLPIAR
jgi:hypothetical protein